jgi:Ca2+-binding RTX toxin-like protein
MPGFEGMPGFGSMPEFGSAPGFGSVPGWASLPAFPSAPGEYNPSDYGQTVPSDPGFDTVKDARSQLQSSSGDLSSVLDPAQSWYADAQDRAARNPEATQQLAAGQQALADVQASGQAGIDDAARTVSGTLQEAGSAVTGDIAAGMDQLENAPRVSDEVSRALGADGAGVALREFDAMVAQMQGLLGEDSGISTGRKVRDGILAGLDRAGAMAGASGPVPGTVLDGGTGDDIVVGDGGDDTLIGGADDDLLIGRRGDDALYGGTGSDTYLYARGDGWDTLYSSNEPAESSASSDDPTGSSSAYDPAGSSSSLFTSDPGQADGTTPQTSLDVLVLDGGISRRDVWFWRDGNDLRVGAGAWNGNSLGVSGGVAVSGWTAGDRDALDRIVSSDGYTLDASRIDRLVSAMAAFGAPGAGSITLTQQQRDSVNAVIAQSWQSAA